MPKHRVQYTRTHRLLTIEELAIELQVNPDWVERYRHEFPVVSVGPRLIRFDLDDVIACLKKRGRDFHTKEGCAEAT